MNDINTYITEERAYIDRPPSWILHSGISLAAVIVMLVLLLSYFIQYPDKINGTGSLTTSIPPLELLSKSEGYIQILYKNNGESVAVGDTLLYIRNTANLEDVNALSMWIDNNTNNGSLLKEVQQLPPKLELGTLNDTYSQLLTALDALKQHLNNHLPEEQAYNYKKELGKQVELQKVQEKERQIFEQEMALERKKHQRNIRMQKDGLISIQELESSESTTIQKERQISSIENAIVQNQIRRQQIQLDITRLKTEKAQKTETLLANINEIILRMKASIKDWSDAYLIVATSEGNLSLLDKIKNTTHLNTGDHIGYILPSRKSENYFSVKLPIQNAGKVEPGMKALIRLDAYPYKEYGLLTGTVGHIAALPIAGSEQQVYYEITIPLPEKLNTDVGKGIPIRTQMTAQVEIITESKTILERIFQQFISLVKKQTL